MVFSAYLVSSASSLSFTWYPALVGISLLPLAAFVSLGRVTLKFASRQPLPSTNSLMLPPSLALCCMVLSGGLNASLCPHFPNLACNAAATASDMALVQDAWEKLSGDALDGRLTHMLVEVQPSWALDAPLVAKWQAAQNACPQLQLLLNGESNALSECEQDASKECVQCTQIMEEGPCHKALQDLPIKDQLTGQDTHAQKLFSNLCDHTPTMKKAMDTALVLMAPQVDHNAIPMTARKTLKRLSRGAKQQVKTWRQMV